MPQGNSTKTEQPRQLRLDLDLGLPPAVAVRLRDAHRFPLVGIRSTPAEFHTRRVPARRAWSGTFEYVQTADTGSSFCAIALDCDAGAALYEALADLQVPPPTWIVWRTTETGERRAHAIWSLQVPVHHGRTARVTPLRMLARCAEWLAHATSADRGYNGLLSRCPTFERTDLEVEYGREEPYTLAEIGEWIPKGWRRPSLPRTAPGRNCAVFEGLRRWAYKPRHWGASFDEVLAAARRLNALHEVPLGEREVLDIAKSVYGWVAERLESEEWTERTFRSKQAARGRKGGIKSGVARRRENAPRDEAIVKARLETGASHRDLAKQFDIDQSTVGRILERKTPILR